jgi:hypothetical protein
LNLKLAIFVKLLRSKVMPRKQSNEANMLFAYLGGVSGE